MSMVENNVTPLAVPRAKRGPVATDAASLLTIIGRLAADPATDVEKIRQLMALHADMEATQAKRAFARAFASVQPLLPAVKRNGRLVINDKAGKQIQSTPYALWEDIHAAITPILGTHGLSLSFRTDNTAEGRIKVTAVLLHEDGHEIETSMTLPVDASGSKNNVQGAGSSTSYGKRYTATSLLNIRTEGEDDDGKAGGSPEVFDAPSTLLIDDRQFDTLQDLIRRTSTKVEGFLKFFAVESLSDLPAAKYEQAHKLLNDKLRVLNGGNNRG